MDAIFPSNVYFPLNLLLTFYDLFKLAFSYILIIFHEPVVQDKLKNVLILMFRDKINFKEPFQGPARLSALSKI